MSRRITNRRSLFAVVAAALVVAAMSAVAAYAAGGTTKTSFDLVPNPKFVNCLARYPGDPSRAPTASVDVQKGNLNDRLTLHLQEHQAESGVRPVHRAAQLARRTTASRSPGAELRPRLVPVGHRGGRRRERQREDPDDPARPDLRLRTSTVALTPTNTFHVGFWFNDPNDAAACGFDVTQADAVQRRAQGGPAGDDQPARRDHRPRPALPQAGRLGAQRLRRLSRPFTTEGAARASGALAGPARRRARS